MLGTLRTRELCLELGMLLKKIYTYVLHRISNLQCGLQTLSLSRSKTVPPLHTNLNHKNLLVALACLLDAFQKLHASNKLLPELVRSFGKLSSLYLLQELSLRDLEVNPIKSQLRPCLDIG